MENKPENCYRYVPYYQIGDEPHIIVDGAPLSSTCLNLSHWPVNNTPDTLRRDTSTETVFAWLDQGDTHQSPGIVSNNHFDEDGLFSVFAVCEPELAARHRKLLVDASYAGDFGVVRTPEAARLCFVLESYGCQATSPFPASSFDGEDEVVTAALYAQMLGLLPVLLENIDAYESFWQAQDAHLTESQQWLDSGRVRIEEFHEHDLAVVHIPEDLPLRTVTRYFQNELAAVHPFAIQTATDCTRLLRIQGRNIEFQYRYETWVRFVSRRPKSRVKLNKLCLHLNALESSGDSWILEEPNNIIPRLYLDGNGKTSIDSADIFEALIENLAGQPVAWDPFDWKPDRGEPSACKG